jgi:2-polyprenyl-3-methyl-5-hydroxy-6-metoxy-1,4-benzoquinol methylase
VRRTFPSSSEFDAGIDRCRSCGHVTARRARFWQAFPEHVVVDGTERAALPLHETPPEGAWLMTECVECAAVSPLPYPDAAMVDRYYAESLAPSDWEREHYVELDRNPKAMEHARRVADQFTRLHGAPAALLEVGCAGGWILRAARDRGWTVKGIEAAPKFSRHAIDVLGLDVFAGRVTDVDGLDWPRFDVIAGFDVLEHLWEPARELEILRRLARDDGWLIMTTPNVESAVARRYGTRWRQVVISHLNYSTPSSVERLLRRAGWRLHTISEPRYWDPDPRIERRQRIREVAKYAVRRALVPTVVNGAGRSHGLRQLPGRVTRGQLSWHDLTFRIGDQAVLGDVMLVVARPT